MRKGAQGDSGAYSDRGPLLGRAPRGAYATRALGVGLAAGREDEVGPRRGLPDEPATGAEDQEPDVGTLTEADPAARVRRSAGPPSDGDTGGGEAGWAPAARPFFEAG